MTWRRRAPWVGGVPMVGTDTTADHSSPAARVKPHLRLEASPVARAEAIVQGDRWRITMLADGLLRLEWSDDGVFETPPSTVAVHRDLPVPDFRVIDGDATLELVTDRLLFVYDRGPFT